MNEFILWFTICFVSENRFPLEVEDYVEFSKATQDKILGTKGETASVSLLLFFFLNKFETESIFSTQIYDVNTGTLVTRLIPAIGNQYTKNKATFSPTDELVLSDGVLFDVNSGKQIHKLDKLNQTQSGVFHPNGLEVNTFIVY